MVDDVVILRPLHEAPLLPETLRPEAPDQARHVEGALVRGARVADDVADRHAQAVGQGRIEAGPIWRRVHHVRIHVPILGMMQRLWPVCMQRGGEVLAKPPSVRRAVVIDDAHLVVTESVDTVFIEKEFRVLDKEIPHLRLGEVEDEASGMALVREIEGVPLPASRRLAVEEVQALIAELTARMVVDHVEDHSQAVEMTEIYQRLELIHFSAQILRPVTAQALRIEETVHLGDVRRQVVIRHGEIHLGRKIVGAVVAEAEAGLEFLNGQELQRRDAELGQIWQLARDIEKRAAFVRQIRCEEGADVELIEDELMKGRRDVPAVVPGKVGLADDALAGKGRFELPGVGISLQPLAPFPDNIEHVALAVPNSGNEASPMAELVAREQTRVVAHPLVEVANHIHGPGLRRPDAEGGAIGDQIGPHRGNGMDVVERRWHGGPLGQGSYAFMLTDQPILTGC